MRPANDALTTLSPSICDEPQIATPRDAGHTTDLREQGQLPRHTAGRYVPAMADWSWLTPPIAAALAAAIAALGALIGAVVTGAINSRNTRRQIEAQTQIALRQLQSQERIAAEARAQERALALLSLVKGEADVVQCDVSLVASKDIFRRHRKHVGALASKECRKGNETASCDRVAWRRNLSHHDPLNVAQNRAADSSRPICTFRPEPEFAEVTTCLIQTHASDVWDGHETGDGRTMTAGGSGGCLTGFAAPTQNPATAKTRPKMIDATINR